MALEAGRAATVSHGVTRREAPEQQETLLWTCVDVRRGSEGLILVNDIERPSIHPQPQGIGH